jgi:hypothetical protein
LTQLTKEVLQQERAEWRVTNGRRRAKAKATSQIAADFAEPGFMNTGQQQKQKWHYTQSTGPSVHGSALAGDNQLLL